MTGPTLLLVHAAGTGAAQWKPNQERWARQGLASVAVDVPGHAPASLIPAS